MFKRRPKSSDSIVDSDAPIWLSDHDQPFDQWVYGDLDLPSLRTIFLPPLHLMDDPVHRVVI